MDNLIAPIATFVLGTGVVGGFVVKYAAKAKKYLGLAASALSLLELVLKSVEDKTVTEAEVKAIREKANEMLAVLKA